jgi:hypothetical protein
MVKDARALQNGIRVRHFFPHDEKFRFTDTEKQGNPRVATWLSFKNTDQMPPFPNKPSRRSSEASSASGPLSTGAAHTSRARGEDLRDDKRG